MPRRLRPEERALWAQITDQVTPLDRRARNAAMVMAEPKAPSPPRESSALPMPMQPLPLPRRSAPPVSLTSHSLSPDPFTALEARPPRMDAKAHAKLKRGKLAPEARLDLHGMTLREAEPVLRAFLLRAVRARMRLVLVITGKGRGGGMEEGPLPVRRGALRHMVPDWLHRPPLSAHVLQITPAHQRHGGQGALYVYLRKTP